MSSSHQQQQQPKSQSSTLNPAAREWFPPGYQPEPPRAETGPHQAVIEPFNSDAAPAVLPLSELPAEILSSVTGFLRTPHDLFSCILTSQQLRAAVRSGHMRLELKGRPRQLLSFPAQARQLDDLVQSLTRYMPAMSTCDLSMLPLEHRHVSKLSQGLHLLQHLDLSGCKKLQPSMTQQLLMGLASKQLRSLNLQRCFQLTDACLTDVLEYACGSHSSSKALQCIALSHLDLAAWPAGAAATAKTAAADGMQSQDLDNNSSSSNHSDETAGSSDGETAGADTAARSNDLAGVAAAGSTAVQWGALADRLLHKLPKQLGARLPADGSAAALRVVVLNNCSALSVGGLVAMAGACPQLEYLFLGGSTLKLPVAGSSGAQAAAVYVPRSVAAAAAAGPAGEGSTTGSDTELPAALQQLSDLLQLPQTLPWEALSSCCDADCCSSSGCGQAACSCTCGCCSNAQQRGRAGSDAGGGGAEEHERARKRLHRNEPSAAAVATARGHALCLAYVAALLPGLKAVEVTFMVPGLAGWLRVCLNRLQQVRQHHTATSPSNSLFSSGSMGSPEGNPRPKVWQFSCAVAVADALATLSEALRAHRAVAGSSACSGSTTTSSGGGSVQSAALLDPDCLSMAVRCAVNCSSRGRSTPLHMAADAGCACHLHGLLAAGAAVAARDASGASALFVACESGQAAAAAVLLGAGADALMGNTAGETPLYIAALRGHLSVVQLLLQHLSAVQVDWTQRQLYGDAWTPLMAAAVANRVNVALCLLRAAATPSNSSSTIGGSSSSSSSRAAGCWLMQAGSQTSCSAVSRLLAAENRYGQTVLHIAARKGCRELLQLLLVYGAGQVAGRVVDAAGDTPLDIARRHGHEGVVRELLQQC